MNPGKILLVYVLSIPVFFVIDMVWLGLVARGFYRKHLGFLLREPVLWPAAIIFYLLFIVGIIVFAVLPAVETASPYKALMLGALFGFLAYATYDLTNLATVKNWPLVVVIVDMCWGAVLSAAVALCAYFIAGWVG